MISDKERKITVPPLESFSHWPEIPYRWMLSGLVRTMQEIQGPDANYLVALGLVCYTEIMGHEVLKFRKLSHGLKHSKEAFDLFLGEYMGYRDLLDKHPIFDWFRCGLCHEFTIKLKDGGTESGPFHFFSGTNNEAEFLKNNFNVDPTRGIAIAPNGKRILFIEPYLKDFRSGVEKFLKESGQI